MKDIELNNLWKSQDEKLNQLLIVNRELLKDIIKDKAEAMLGRAKPAKYLGIIVGLPWVVFLDAVLVVGWLSGNMFLLCSIAAISLCTKIALGAYIYHLILIARVSYADNVLEIQKQIAKLKTSTIKVLRIAILQLPFWTTWYYSIDMLKEPDTLYWSVNLTVTGVFLYFTIWLFKNLRIENINKKWMKWMLSDAEWNSIIKAEDLLSQLSSYEEAENANRNERG